MGELESDIDYREHPRSKGVTVPALMSQWMTMTTVMVSMTPMSATVNPWTRIYGTATPCTG